MDLPGNSQDTRVEVRRSCSVGNDDEGLGERQPVDLGQSETRRDVADLRHGIVQDTSDHRPVRPGSPAAFGEQVELEQRKRQQLGGAIVQIRAQPAELKFRVFGGTERRSLHVVAEQLCLPKQPRKFCNSIAQRRALAFDRSISFRDDNEETHEDHKTRCGTKDDALEFWHCPDCSSVLWRLPKTWRPPQRHAS